MTTKKAPRDTHETRMLPYEHSKIQHVNDARSSYSCRQKA